MSMQLLALKLLIVKKGNFGLHKYMLLVKVALEKKHLWTKVKSKALMIYLYSLFVHEDYSKYL